MPISPNLLFQYRGGAIDAPRSVTVQREMHYSTLQTSAISEGGESSLTVQPAVYLS